MRIPRILFAILLATNCSMASAQTDKTYIVSSTNGNVVLIHKGTSTPVKPLMQLTDNNILSIAKGGELVLNCPETMIQYTCNTPGKCAVSDIVAKSTTVGQLNKKFLYYLRMQISKNSVAAASPGEERKGGAVRDLEIDDEDGDAAEAEEETDDKKE